MDNITIQMPRWAQRLREDWRFKVLYGGRGSAKSWTVARDRLLLSTEQPLQGLCARETQESLADSVHRLLGNQIEEMKLPGWTIQRERIFNRNGSQITFAGIRTDPKKIKSAESVDWCWVEEAETVSKVSWDVLIPTIRGKGRKREDGTFAGSEVILTFNPNEATDPTYQRFIVNPPENALILKVNWRDNPWFPEALKIEKDHLARVDPDSYAHVWEGACVSRSDSQVLRGKWRVEDFEPKSHWDGPYFGLDFGFAADPNHAVECYVGDGNLWIRREARAFHMDTDQIPGFLEQEIPAIASRELRCDNARPETISYLQRHGLPKAMAAHKWAGSIQDGIKWLRSHDAIVIHTDAPHLAAEARLWSHKVDRLTDEVLPDVLDENNHGWDAVRYALDPAIRGERFASRKKLVFSNTTPNNPWGR